MVALCLKKLCQSGRDVLIVFDEAHHLGATQTIDRFVKYIPDNFYTLGLTATPTRADGTMAEVYPYFDSESLKVQFILSCLQGRGGWGSV